MYALLYIYMLKLHLVFLVDVFTLAPVVCLCLLSLFNDDEREIRGNVP